MYDLGIVGYFRDEGLYLKDWIEFHLKAGVQFFWMYNNLSKDNYLDILQPYINAGVMEIRDWTIPSGGQKHALKDFFKRKPDVKWVAHIDIDEFLFPTEKNNLVNALEEFDKPGVAGVAVSWHTFCYDEPDKYIPAPVWERFRQRYYGIWSTNKSLLQGGPLTKQNGSWIKCIVRPDRINHPNIYTVHNFPARQGYCVVDEDFIPISATLTNRQNCRQVPVAKQRKFCIYHYYTKSWPELARVKLTRPAGNSASKYNPKFFKAIYNLPREPEDLIFQFLKKVEV